MNRVVKIVGLTACAFAYTASAARPGSYTGQEQREIKAPSAEVEAP